MYRYTRNTKHETRNTKHEDFVYRLVNSNLDEALDEAATPKEIRDELNKSGRTGGCSSC